MTLDNYLYDVFICHASEDKDDFVRPLAVALQREALKVWYDEFEVRIGDSIQQKINSGISQSRFGIVVISPSFFSKDWTMRELGGFISKPMNGEGKILPIWHRITKDEVLVQNPVLADIAALNSSIDSLDEIARKVTERVKGAESVSPGRPSMGPTQGPTNADARGFAVFYIAPAYTNPLPKGVKPKRNYVIYPELEGWFSMLEGDEELEYVREGTKLRIRLNWGNALSGDEINANWLLSAGEPFAITMRFNDGREIYLPFVMNPTPSYSWHNSPRSGWMVFEIQ